MASAGPVKFDWQADSGLFTPENAIITREIGAVFKEWIPEYIRRMVDNPHKKVTYKQMMEFGGFQMDFLMDMADLKQYYNGHLSPRQGYIGEMPTKNIKQLQQLMNNMFKEYIDNKRILKVYPDLTGKGLLERIQTERKNEWKTQFGGKTVPYDPTGIRSQLTGSGFHKLESELMKDWFTNPSGMLQAFYKSPEYQKWLQSKYGHKNRFGKGESNEDMVNRIKEMAETVKATFELNKSIYLKNNPDPNQLARMVDHGEMQDDADLRSAAVAEVYADNQWNQWDNLDVVHQPEGIYQPYSPYNPMAVDWNGDYAVYQPVIVLLVVVMMGFIGTCCVVMSTCMCTIGGLVGYKPRKMIVKRSDDECATDTV